MLYPAKEKPKAFSCRGYIISLLQWEGGRSGLMIFQSKGPNIPFLFSVGDLVNILPVSDWQWHKQQRLPSSSEYHVNLWAILWLNSILVLTSLSYLQNCIRLQLLLFSLPTPNLLRLESLMLTPPPLRVSLEGHHRKIWTCLVLIWIIFFQYPVPLKTSSSSHPKGWINACLWTLPLGFILRF